MTTGNRGAAAGADVGATLVKLAVRDARGDTSTDTLPADELDAVAERLRDVSRLCSASPAAALRAWSNGSPGQR